VIPDAGAWQTYLSHRRSGDVSGLQPPATLPADGADLLDWFQYQSVVLPMQRKAHRFTVLLPWPTTVSDASGATLDHVRLSDLATRVVDVQKPAHTIYDVKFFWAAFRIGDSRLGDDTLLASGSRIPELVEPAVLGRDYIGTTTLAGQAPGDEIRRIPPASSDLEETP
jgi:hypothetical protein